jgi:hypothetical protein
MFEMLKRLFKRGEPPTPMVHDSVLGELKWSEDDEAWHGSYRGRVFSVAYDGSPMPSPRVLAYAREILDDPSWLETSLAQAKAEAAKDFSDFYAAELQALTLGEVHLFVNDRRGECIIAILDGGKDDRAWRIEFTGKRCEGIGFDD